MPLRTAPAPLAMAVLVSVVSTAISCRVTNRRDRSAERRGGGDVESAAPYQAEVEEGLGAAVAILVDTSGSMRDDAPGDSRPKYVVAQEALEAMLDATDAFVARRPDFPDQDRHLQLLEQRPDAAADSALRSRRDPRARWRSLPRPGGGTAIGEAMREARPDLYRAGVFRKYLLVVTDGENTSGRSPDDVAREIFRKSEGAVQIYFVAFDTSPEKFAFLKEVGGDVIGAGTGAGAAHGARRHLPGQDPRRGARRRRAGTGQEVTTSCTMSKETPVILHKFWSAFVAQINKVANLFWEADPIAQMRYEYDRAVEQLKEGRVGLEQYRGLVERVTRQVSANRSHVQKLEAETKAYLKAGDRATAAKFALELQKAKEELADQRAAAATCTRRRTATA